MSINYIILTDNFQIEVEKGSLSFYLRKRRFKKDYIVVVSGYDFWTGLFGSMRNASFIRKTEEEAEVIMEEIRHSLGGSQYPWDTTIDLRSSNLNPKLKKLQEEKKPKLQRVVLKCEYCGQMPKPYHTKCVCCSAPLPDPKFEVIDT